MIYTIIYTTNNNNNNRSNCRCYTLSNIVRTTNNNNKQKNVLYPIYIFTLLLFCNILKCSPCRICTFYFHIFAHKSLYIYHDQTHVAVYCYCGTFPLRQTRSILLLIHIQTRTTDVLRSSMYRIL